MGSKMRMVECGTVNDAHAATTEFLCDFVVEYGFPDHNGSRLTLSVESNSERYFAIDTKFEGQYQGFWKGSQQCRLAIYESEEKC